MPGPNSSQTSPLKILQNGSSLTQAKLDGIMDVTIEQDLILPDMFFFRIDDRDDSGRKQAILLDDDAYPVGDTIEILMGEEEAPASVVKGEITAIEYELTREGRSVLTVRGYSRAHRLHRGQHTRTYLNMSDADMVRKIANLYGLSALVDGGDTVHSYILQENQTDWEFLRARADRLGNEVRVDDETLIFRAPSSADSAPEKQYPETLYRVRTRISTARQVDTTSVVGWDAVKKRQIVGSSRAQSAALKPENGIASGAAMASSFGPATAFVTNETFITQGEADDMALAVHDEASSDFVHLEATCLGDPDIRPGKSIQIKGVSSKLNGTYYITAATHRLTPGEGYMTTFSVSGKHPLTLTALLSPQNLRARNPERKVYGVVPAVVTNNKDPEGALSRVKVQFPWLPSDGGSGIESNWARIVTPMAGGARGFHCLPEVNDEVLVAFEQGDVNRPYVVGALWNNVDASPLTPSAAVGASGKVVLRQFKSRMGHMFTFDDSDSGPKITIVDKTGSNSIEIQSMGNKIVITSAGDTEITAKGNLTLKGTNVKVEATATLNLQGQTSEFKGLSTVKVNAPIAEVKGAAALTLEASGVTSVKGALVKIN